MAKECRVGVRNRWHEIEAAGRLGPHHTDSSKRAKVLWAEWRKVECISSWSRFEKISSDILIMISHQGLILLWGWSFILLCCFFRETGDSYCTFSTVLLAQPPMHVWTCAIVGWPWPWDWEEGNGSLEDGSLNFSLKIIEHSALSRAAVWVESHIGTLQIC